MRGDRELMRVPPVPPPTRENPNLWYFEISSATGLDPENKVNVNLLI